MTEHGATYIMRVTIDFVWENYPQKVTRNILAVGGGY